MKLHPDMNDITELALSIVRRTMDRPLDADTRIDTIYHATGIARRTRIALYRALDELKRTDDGK